MVSVGIDIGSVATKVVVFDGEIVSTEILPTGWDPKKTAEEAVKNSMKKAGLKLEQIKKIVATGYGRVSIDFADKIVTEITCHAKGAFYTDEKIRSIIDVGGQDSKVISLNEKGDVIDFVMNDRCAAGTGRFLQNMSVVLGMSLEEFSNLNKEKTPVKINSMCAVFAESEVISLLAKGIDKYEVAVALFQSIVEKIEVLAARVGIRGRIAFTGGLSRNKFLVEMLTKKLNGEIVVFEHSQHMGALGAAVIGYGL